MRQGALTQGLGAGWRSIRLHHPDVPDAVIVVASGTENSRSQKWGHWAAQRWKAGDNTLGEVLVAGERLQMGPEAVLETLLHEAAHAMARGRSIQDTSRGGRYHNKRYRALALEVGLSCVQMGHHGWALTDLGHLPLPDGFAECECDNPEPREAGRVTGETWHAVRECGACGCLVPVPVVHRYADELRRLEDVCKHWRAAESHRKRKGSSRLSVECGCPEPRRVQVAPTVFDLGDITCRCCGEPFVVRS